MSSIFWKILSGKKPGSFLLKIELERSVTIPIMLVTIDGIPKPGMKAKISDVIPKIRGREDVSHCEKPWPCIGGIFNSCHLSWNACLNLFSLSKTILSVVHEDLLIG